MTPYVTFITSHLPRISSLYSMKLKGTKLYSILTFKCPVCHEADFFVSHPYDLIRAGDIHASCPECATKFEREPGFFYGAMYVSYAFGVATFVTVWVAMSVLFPAVGMLGQSLAVLGALFISAPFSYALRKILWANFFFSYKGEKEGKVHVIHRQGMQ